MNLLNSENKVLKKSIRTQTNITLHRSDIPVFGFPNISTATVGFLQTPSAVADEPRESSRVLFLNQLTLEKLGDGRPAAELLLDQLRGLGAEPVGGALELRWRHACRRLEQETRRCRDQRDRRSRWGNLLSLPVLLNTRRAACLRLMWDLAEHTCTSSSCASTGRRLICF